MEEFLNSHTMENIHELEASLQVILQSQRAGKTTHALYQISTKTMKARGFIICSVKTTFLDVKTCVWVWLFLMCVYMCKTELRYGKGTEKRHTHQSSTGENSWGYNPVSSWIESAHCPSGKKSFSHQEQKQKMQTG